MTTTRLVCTPRAAERAGGTFPELLEDAYGRPLLAFDAASDEQVAWTSVAPQGLTGTLTFNLTGYMASATSGTLRFEVAVEAVTPGDATDLDAGDSFDTANGVTSATVPATAGYEFTTQVTLTTKDSIAPGDSYRVRVKRVGTDSTNDTASGDFYFRTGELRDAA